MIESDESGTRLYFSPALGEKAHKYDKNMVFEVPCFESGMVVKKNLIFSPYKKSQFMPQSSEFDSPCKSSTFDDEDSINRDREETSEMEGFSPAYG